MYNIDLSEIVNEEDKEYTNGNAFLLAIGSYGEHKYTVYANELSEALEFLGKHCKDNKYNLFIATEVDEDNEYFDEQYFPVNGGEYYLVIPNYIEEIIC